MALEPVTLDESRQLTIYRMVQESLTNIGKYAEAGEATIVMKNYENHVIVEVADNGKGFDTQRMRPSTHGWRACATGWKRRAASSRFRRRPAGARA
jgi:signal transduction histidine kinase